MFVGDVVCVVKTGETGVVEAVAGKTIKVKLGTKSSWLAFEDLQAIQPDTSPPTSPFESAVSVAALIIVRSKNLFHF